MDNYKSIDDFFRVRGAGLKKSPSDRVWKNIESEFFTTKSVSTRKALLAVLASLLLVIGTIWILSSDLYTNDNTTTRTVKTGQVNDSHLVQDVEHINESETVIDLKKPNLISQQSNEVPQITTYKPEAISTSSEPDKVSNQKNYNYNFDFSNNTRLPSFATPVLNKNGGNISINNTPSIIEQNKIITLNEYLYKRERIHMYTGASVSYAMAYYPTSTDQTTWSSDLVYGIKLNRYYIETGIGFQKMKEQGVFQIDYRTHDSVGYYNKVLSFTINPNNPNEIIYKTSPTTVYDSVDHLLLQSPTYSYDYLVFPIKVGYKFITNSRFSIAAETGIIYSMLTKTYTPNVTYDNPYSNLLGISNNTPERTEHNFRLHIALRMNYNITNTISINTQPEFTKFLNSVNVEQNNLNKVKPYTMGIRFGILFNF